MGSRSPARCTPRTARRCGRCGVSRGRPSHSRCVSSTLTIPVRWFVDDVSSGLHELSKTTEENDEGPQHDAATEAFNLTCGFIDADGLHTDDELWALITAFGPLLPTQLGQASPQDVRRAGLVTDARSKLRAVTPMFELLVAADVQNGTRPSHTY